ncbi:sensor histidine kinase [Pedobacter soli]|uniref:histidine kinase n=1 Tax=Pedobacter soli TaxID=390242 RepID=A0A1G7AX27_9SPHI|nr:PAS domain-containing sensor histidine kinase [Pedobacter soli]SDE19127.1 PAS domain S-box-containing protein [Pedobacter soli]
MKITKKISVYLAVASIAFATVGLVGWVTGNSALKSFFSAEVTMKFNMCLMIILSSSGFLLYNFGHRKPAITLILIVALLSFLILFEHIFQVNLGLDEIFFRDKIENPLLEAPGRVSALGCINLLLFCTAMLFAAKGWYHSAQLFAGLLFLFIYGSILGHAFHITGLYRQGFYSGVAIHTTLALLLLVTAVFFSLSGSGWTAFFSGKLRSRNLLIYGFSYLACAAPLLVAFYIFFLKNSGQSSTFGLLSIIIASLLISFPLAYLARLQINRMDNELRKANEQLELSMEATGLGLWDLDIPTGIIERSEKHAVLFGDEFTPHTTGEHLSSLIFPEDRPRIRSAFNEALKGKELRIQVRTSRNDGSIRWVLVSGKIRSDRNGIPKRMLGTIMDISDQKEAEAKKESFIGVVSHELKTPLTAFKSYVQLAIRLSQDLQDEKIASILARASQQSDRMSSMIMGFLDVTRIGNGKLQLQESFFELNELLDSILNESKTIYSRDTFKFTGCEQIMVWADRTRIAEVLSNLISNAVKYSPRDSPVELSCNYSSTEVVISVKDYGMGIPKYDREKLFELFYRIDRKKQDTISGFGIGLYLSAEVVRLHGGRIWLESEEHVGSTFFFSIPLGPSTESKKVQGSPTGTPSILDQKKSL